MSKIPETAPSPEIGLSFKYTPIEYLRSLYVNFLQGLFAEAPSGCYHWEQDEASSEIVIQDESVIDPEVLGKRPGITLVRGPLQLSTLSLDDREFYDSDIDRKTKSVIVSGTVSINAVSRVPLESEKIAWIVMEHVWLLREILLTSGLFETGRGCTLGSPSPAGAIIAGDGGDEYTVTPVNVPLQFVRQSSFMPLNKEAVNSIVNRIYTRVPPVRTVGPPPVGGHEFPLGIYACPPESFYPGASDSHGRTVNPNGTEDRLPKIPHPLNPNKFVTVRQVRPYRPGLRGFVNLGPNAVPIPDPCVEES